jgi:hypothetical protein
MYFSEEELFFILTGPLMGDPYVESLVNPLKIDRLIGMEPGNPNPFYIQ